MQHETPTIGKFDMITLARGRCLSQPFRWNYEAVETTETCRTNLNLRKERRIGTWNVRTLNGPGNVEILAIEAGRLGLDVLGLAETRLEGQGER